MIVFGEAYGNIRTSRFSAKRTPLPRKEVRGGEVVTQRTDEWLVDSIPLLSCPARPMMVEGYEFSRHHRVFGAMSLN